MPTTKRMRRNARATNALTAYQELQLTIGLPGPFFENEDAERQAWMTHRERLLAEHSHYGMRPWGFWKFEVGLKQDPEWPESLEILMDRDEISKQEAKQIESSNGLLGADDPLRHGSALRTPQAIAAMKPEQRVKLARELAAAARWHRSRGRGHVAAACADIARSLTGK